MGLSRTVTSLAVDLRKPQEHKTRLGAPEGSRECSTQQNPKGPFNAMWQQESTSLSSFAPLFSRPRVSRLNTIYYSLNNSARQAFLFSKDFSDTAQGYYSVCPFNSQTGSLPPTLHICYLKFFRAIIKYL